MRPGPLSAQLVALLPGAVVTRCTERNWHSATFSGVRLSLALKLETHDAVKVDAITAKLGDHEFCLPDRFVADIAVAGQRVLPDGIMLSVEALLLDD